MMPLGIHVSVHAREQLVDRWAPADVDAFALELLEESALVGYDRRGHAVYRGPRALLVVGIRPDRIDAIHLVTVMPADWPWDVLGGVYDYRGRDVSASPASLERLRSQLSSSPVSVRRTRLRGGIS